MSFFQTCPLSPVEAIVINAVLCVVLAVATYTDATRAKIYNLLTFPAMLSGLLLNALLWSEGGGAPGAVLTGLKWAGMGLAVGFGLLLVPFWLGGTKAGDVKLLMAVGALKGWEFVLVGFLYGAVLFGVAATLILARRGKLGRTLSNISNYFYGLAVLQSAPELSPPADDSKYPYGISLCLGFVLALVLQYTLGRPNFWQW
jgi:prepilin peptidase CpaA